MNFKFKVNESTTLKDARNFLDELKSANVKEYNLNDILRVLHFLGAEEITAKGGSAIRFRHEILVGHPHHLDGIFKIHIIHKGGAKQLVSKIDFKVYMYGPLIQIIELQEAK